MTESARPSLLATRLAWAKRNRQAHDQATHTMAGHSAPGVDLSVRILASFTANPLEPYLGMALLDAGIAASVQTGPYNQILPELIMPTSESSQARPDVVIVWPRLQDCWAGRPAPLSDPLEDYVDPLDEIVTAALSAASSWSTTVVFVLPAVPELPPLGVGDAGNPYGVAAAAGAARELARRRLADQPGVLVADAEEMVRWVGVRAAIDPRREAAARIPYTEEGFADIGGRVARLVSLARRGAKKVAVVDADNTLWGGIVGEEGAAGVDLLENGPGSAYRDFQRWLMELRRAGLLLCVASKNNEGDVWEAFERSDMVVRKGDLAAWRVNWKPKSENIDEMAAELNLGTASMVFIDDNPMELAEVGAALPEVAHLQMPSDPVNWRWDVAASGVLERLRPTASDMARAQSYAIETQRREVRDQQGPEQFLKSLGLQVSIAEPVGADLARLAQLVAKTNQFTLDGHRHSEAELAALIKSSDHRVRLVSARDRFGDYGVIGAFIVALGATEAVLDTFVLSCRAMGRGVEDAMLATALALAAPHELAVTVVTGKKNQPARGFFAAHGATATDQAQFVAPTEWPDHVEVP